MLFRSTANLMLHDEKLLPRDGVYAAWARIDGEDTRHPVAMSIGLRPTFGDQARAVEAHLIDWSGELVGRELMIELESWLHGQVKYESPEALAVAIKDDIRQIRARLAATSPTP